MIVVGIAVDLDRVPAIGRIRGVRNGDQEVVWLKWVIRGRREPPVALRVVQHSRIEREVVYLDTGCGPERVERRPLEQNAALVVYAVYAVEQFHEVIGSDGAVRVRRNE